MDRDVLPRLMATCIKVLGKTAWPMEKASSSRKKQVSFTMVTGKTMSSKAKARNNGSGENTNMLETSKKAKKLERVYSPPKLAK